MINQRRREIAIALLLALLPIHSMAVNHVVNLWSVNLDHKPFSHKTAVVGDTITFKLLGPHTVWIHPSGNCADVKDRVEVGVRGSGTATYEFTDEDAGKSVFFTCDSGTHCSMGQNMIVKVYGTLDKLPISGKVLIDSGPERIGNYFSAANYSYYYRSLSFVCTVSILGWMLAAL